MATREPQNSQWGLGRCIPLGFWVLRQLSLNKFFDPSTSSMRKRCDRGNGATKIITARTSTDWRAKRLCQNDCNSGANDDCVRPNGFVGGTPLPKSSFDDGLHNTGFISPLTLVRFNRYSRSFYLSGHQPPCHFQRVALPDLRKKRSKLRF